MTALIIAACIIMVFVICWGLALLTQALPIVSVGLTIGIIVALVSWVKRSEIKED